jgi:WD40 repeat protein
MPRLFISHSSANDDWAIALHDWLIGEGWAGEDDIFLDLDPERGIVAGQRWAKALEDAATRCEAVLFMVSDAWLASKWCADEYQLANKYNKKLFALLIDDIELGRLPGGLAAQWQVVHLKGEPAQRFLTVHPRTRHQSPVHIAEVGLKSLKRGLQKAGIGAETFEIQVDPNGPFGWREPYRGLEPFEPEDAAVFFGRSADIVRGMDTLRGLAARKPPRLLVVLGASGAGKSSFLRAGLWPRLARDDAQWLPLRAIRAGRGGAIEGSEGLLSAIDEVHRRFGQQAGRADLRQRLATCESFIALLGELRTLAARRALLTEPPNPLPVICLDQAEELFAADAGVEAERLLRLAVAAMEAGGALVLASIRSDAYGLMQSAQALRGIHQVPMSLGPVPLGEIARVIREPSELLRRKVGPSAPVFEPAVIERLQAEIAGEPDALPLLAFALQRLMREHATTRMIGMAELERTGGVTAAIESEAEAALADAGIAADSGLRREVLRRLFIPRLARIDRESKAPQRRIAGLNELPSDLLGLAHALTHRRLLVLKLAAQVQYAGAPGTATLEVAHEALLRHWPTLTDLLAEDRDALLLLDGVLNAASDWTKAEPDRKQDFLLHRGTRLLDAQTLRLRGRDWEAEIVPAAAYLAACQAREDAERKEREAALANEEARLAQIAAAQDERQRAIEEREAAVKRESEAQKARARARRIIVWGSAAAVALVVLGVSGFALQQRRNAERQALLTADAVHERAEAEKQTILAGAKTEEAEANFRAGQKTESYFRAEQAKQSGADVATAALLALEGLPDSTSADDAQRTRPFVNETWHALYGERLAQRERVVLGGHIGAVYSAVFRPDGGRILTASNDNTARLWDRDGKPLAILQGHTAAVRTAVFAPDGGRILTASDDKTARLWDRDGKPLATFKGHTGRVTSAVFAPDGRRVLTASDDETARLWGGGKPPAILQGHTGRVTSAVFAPNGCRILTASTAGDARLWDCDGKPLVILKGHIATINSAVFAPDGRYIVTAADDGTARLWDGDGKPLATFQGHAGRVTSAVFAPDGGRILTASTDGSAKLWDRDGKPLATFQGHTGPVASAAFAPDGGSILTASDDKTVRLWDRDGKPLATLQGHTGRVTGAVFAPDSGRILTVSDDKTARLWDRDGKPLNILRGHTSGVNSALFAPDGDRIVTASWDNTARLWDRDGKPLATLQGHTDHVTGAVFSPNGGRILTASRDKTARLWEAFPDPQALVDRVKAEMPRCLTSEQRERLFLAPTPSRWCIDMHKWPYDGSAPTQP